MPRVRFEPIGEEIDVQPGETVLDAAFRQGYNLAYGCREGQCSACKCFLLEGDAELKPYSSFALSDSEREGGYSLMCRAMPEADAVIELLHYDRDSYRLEHPIRDGVATVTAVEALTADIQRLVLAVESPADFTFTPGQYVDLHVPGEDGARRSFSLANLPARPGAIPGTAGATGATGATGADSGRSSGTAANTGPGRAELELFIKCYPGGRISGLLEAGEITVGQRLGFTGPYGAMKARPGAGPVLMIGGGSGMAPILSLLRAFAAETSGRPIHFFYGARAEADLFGAEAIAAAGAALGDFQYTPVTERFVHEAVGEFLTDHPDFAAADVYMCGPPPMLEAVEEMLLSGHGFAPEHIFQDKFTTSADAGGGGAGAGAASAAPAGPPVKRFSALPAVGDESERHFAWFTPAKARASLYEDVTVDTQPSIHRHVTRGWPVSFADGRGTWDDASTRVASADWFAFRDPGEQWERPYYVSGNAGEQQIEGAVASAIEEGIIADFSPAWVAFLRRFLQLPAFVEHGLWFATATVARDGLSDSVSQCIALQAAMKQRSAQALVLYAMDLEPIHGPFPIEAARESFLTEPAWQPTRRYLEALAATPDWCEVIVAANLCFEPLLGTLLRRELGFRAAAAHGDVVTPVLAGVATQEWEWTRAWSTNLSRFLLADPLHGETNAAVIGGWIERWLPDAVAAALALLPLAEAVPLSVDLDAVGRYGAEVLTEAGLAVHTPLLGVDLIPTPAADAGLPGPASAPTRRVRTGEALRSRVGDAHAEATPAGSAPVPDAIPAAGVGGGPGPAPSADGTYDFVGIVMAKSAEGDAVAAVMGRRDGVRVLEHAAFWDVRSEGRLVIPFDEVSEQLGYEIDSYSIQHEMSTHYGRMVATDDALMLFSDPTEAMQYLMA
ncbi:MmoB/DmpM family protein [Conexibacter sp. DBS9H8]|uniref:MmoB/DmpM family protein n=1 Tax=Conexibacter sp. DBS9H8 TaxID=2937801 RepID=UPI00200CF798|nr:MmoB/DmpM family protein [Conexibacter sp. DBS9H8]